MASINNDIAKSMLRGALLLIIAAAVGGGLVVTIYQSTAERIAFNERTAFLRKLDALVPEDYHDNNPLEDTIEVLDPDLLGSRDPVTVYRARRNGEPIAAALEVTAPDGYSGAIVLLVAIETDGVIAGVRTLKHRETPGLGDKIDIAKDDWIREFHGKSLDNPRNKGWQVRKDGGDFDQFTGATITPRAVVRAVHHALQFFDEEKAQLLAPLPSSADDDDTANASADTTLNTTSGTATDPIGPGHE